MANPVNRLTGDAPDGQNPDKKYVPKAPEGKWKYTPPPAPKPDPKDAGIFTEEKLQRSGGKMKEPPMGLDSKKKGGVIKKRFADGGEAIDKEAGLAASNKEEPVGFFKRLMMGNIDAPGSEAYNKFGAGRGRVENMPAAPVREAIKRPSDDGFKPEPVKASDYPDRGENLKDTTGTIKYSSDYDSVKKEPVKQEAVKLVKEVAKPSAPSVNPRDVPRRGIRPTDARDAEKGMSRGIPEDESWKATAKAAQDEARDDAVFRARAKAAQDAAKPVKHPGILQRMRDQDNARKKAGEASRRQDSGDLGTLFPLKRGGNVKAYAQGGSVSSRGDGCAQRGKTRGRMV